uniref:Uncharacterized protein n=1 Tax=Callorhinchus milii TaxID=7868 RepID=A0A4W3GKY1_CALMI
MCYCVSPCYYVTVLLCVTVSLCYCLSVLLCDCDSLCYCVTVSLCVTMSLYVTVFLCVLQSESSQYRAELWDSQAAQRRAQDEVQSRDQQIQELQRLVTGMEQEHGNLQTKIQTNELLLREMRSQSQIDTTDHHRSAIATDSALHLHTVQQHPLHHPWLLLHLAKPVRNFGVLFDPQLSFLLHICAMTRSASPTSATSPDSDTVSHRSPRNPHTHLHYFQA